MEMVSAAKMRKAQLLAIQTRPYAQKALEILSRLTSDQAVKEIYQNVFLAGSGESRKRETANMVLIVAVTSDKGLIGAFNGNVIKQTMKIVRQYQRGNTKAEIIAVGARSKSHFERLGVPVSAVFTGTGDFMTLEETVPIAKYIRARYKSEEIREVIAVYTEFVTTLKQRVIHRRFLPVTPQILKDIINDIIPEEGKFAEVKNRDPQKIEYAYVYEPRAQELLDVLVPQLLDVYAYQIVLESNASEHSARMITMKNASDNAKKLLEELTLKYNNARQSAITKEISEITAGVEAMNT